ncbi:hypothetical protein ACPC39_33210 [Streptomyces cellulosae]
MERPYFVVGQWTGGGEVDIWHVEEAPADPDARAGAHEQHASDAETDFGSVNVVYSTSPRNATAPVVVRASCSTRSRPGSCVPTPARGIAEIQVKGAMS